MYLWRWIGVFALLCATAPAALAQEGACEPEAEDEGEAVYGTLKVQLIDPFNSVVVNDATVTVPGGFVTHDEFSGLFIVPCLLLGQVPVIVEAPGFEGYVGVVTLADEVQFETIFLQPVCGPGVAGFSRVDVQLIDPLISDVVTEAAVQINGENASFDIFRGVFYTECVPWGEASLIIDAPGYLNYTTTMNITADPHLETALLTSIASVEGEGEGHTEGCKGCSVLTSVFVSVYNEDNNKPVLGANVRLQGSGAQATPSNYGVYTFPLLTDGNYTILVSAPGFLNQSVQISVSSQVGASVSAPMTPSFFNVFTHAADEDADGTFSLGELLGVIQLYNAQQYHCEPDGYYPGPGSRACPPHSCDFRPAGGDYQLTLSELLRGIQIYTYTAYFDCAEATEDGFCLGEQD